MYKFSVILFSITSLIFHSFADTIYLKDKSVLSGEIVTNDSDDLGFKTQFFGTLKVEKKDIDKIEITTDNEALCVDLEADTKYFNDSMVIWNYEKALTGENRVVLKEEKKNQWLYRASFDLNSTDGNTDSRKFGGSLHAKYEEGGFRLNTSLSGEHQVVNDEEAQNNMRYLFQYENTSEPHSWYSTSEVRYDAARDLEYHFSESLGYVHYLTKKAGNESRLRFGGFVSTERFRGRDATIPAGIDVGFYGYHTFENSWRLVTDIGYKSAANEIEDYDTYHESYIEIPLDKERMWSLHLGLRHDYDNQVPDNIERLERRYYLRLSMGWFVI